MELLQVPGSLLNGHAPGDLAHRRQQRQLTRRKLDRLVGNTGGAAFDVRLSQFLIRGKMKIGEDRLTLPHALPLGLDRLLDLHDHVRFSPYRICVRQNRCACLHIELIGKPTALAGSLLHVYGMTALDERFGAGRDERDSVLVGLDFLGNADLHRKGCEWFG